MNAIAPVAATRDIMRIVIVGHVDHGKSTLVGRMFHDTDSLPEGKVEAIREMCKKRGMPFEYAFLMDAMQAERDQGITIDTSQIWFKTDHRDYVIIDAPGHTEFLKNMITGASQADAALLVIDAGEGVREQSRRHGYLLHLMGIRQVAVAVNKMDLVDYEEEQFRLIKEEYSHYLSTIGVEATHFVPVSAREGDLIAMRTNGEGKANMDWYEGPTVVDALDGFQVSVPPKHKPLRMMVQDVYKFDDRRIIAGRIESGRVRVGDTLLFSPANKTSKVASIESWPSDKEQPQVAEAGQSVGFTLTEQIFVERGNVVSLDVNPPVETDVFKAKVFWLGREPLKRHKTYKIKIGTSETSCQIQEIERIVDTSDLSQTTAEQVERNQVGEVILRSKRMLALDEFIDNPRTGRFVIVDDYDLAGGGIISREGYANQRDVTTPKSTNIYKIDTTVTRDLRERRNGHKGGVLWLTGLSGAGKSTVAVALETALFERGYATFVLDGYNVRYGLNANLGFSPEDRAENIRRVGEVAALFAQAGVIVVSSFISPYRSDRDRARQSVGDEFHEIYVATPIEECERRDPKGLYKKARSGEIKEFTGVSAPYEPPEEAEYVLQTAGKSVDACVEELLGYVGDRFRV
ncbi:MAG: adenylyl-sulfate kinase [Maricaulaceae bacterium]